MEKGTMREREVMELELAWSAKVLYTELACAVVGWRRPAIVSVGCLEVIDNSSPAQSLGRGGSLLSAGCLEVTQCAKRRAHMRCCWL